MKQYELAERAIEQKARSERIYLHYALLRAVLLVIAGTCLVIVGVGGRVDIVLSGRDDLEARILNASPGVVLWLVGALIFWVSKPRRLEANASHGNESANVKAVISAEITTQMTQVRRKIDILVTRVEEHLDSYSEELMNDMERQGRQLSRSLREQIEDDLDSARVAGFDLGNSPVTDRVIRVRQIEDRYEITDGAHTAIWERDGDRGELSRVAALEMLADAAGQVTIYYQGGPPANLYRAAAQEEAKGDDAQSE